MTDPTRQDPTRQHLDEKPCGTCGSPHHGTMAHDRLVKLERDPHVNGSAAQGLVRRCDRLLELLDELVVHGAELQERLAAFRRIDAPSEPPSELTPTTPE